MRLTLSRQLSQWRLARNPLKAIFRQNHRTNFAGLPCTEHLIDERSDHQNKSAYHRVNVRFRYDTCGQAKRHLTYPYMSGKQHSMRQCMYEYSKVCKCKLRRKYRSDKKCGDDPLCSPANVPVLNPTHFAFNRFLKTLQGHVLNVLCNTDPQSSP